MAYFMKNACILRERPKSMTQKIYDTLFHAAAFAGMSKKQQEDYMEWWRIRQDNYNADRRAKRIAREEGRAEAFKLMAEQLFKAGMDKEEVERLLKEAQSEGRLSKK